MNPFPACTLLALGLSLSPAPIQGGTPQGGGAKPKGPPQASTVIQSEIQGAWRLTKLETNTLRTEQRSEAGYLLITDGYLSFECHIAWLEVTGDRQAQTYFSGIHSYEMGQDGVLRLTSLISSTVDPEVYRPLFEPPGKRREYRVALVGDTLSLTRVSDQQKFTFARLARAEGLDFYGRRKKPAPPKSGEGAGGSGEAPPR